MSGVDVVTTDGGVLISEPQGAVHHAYDMIRLNTMRRQIQRMLSDLEYYSVVTGARIEAIGQSVDDIDVICHDLPEESHIDGLLGLNFLRHFDQTIRYSDATLCLERIPQKSDPTAGRARGALGDRPQTSTRLPDPRHRQTALACRWVPTG